MSLVVGGYVRVLVRDFERLSEMALKFLDFQDIPASTYLRWTLRCLGRHRWLRKIHSGTLGADPSVARS